ncbi:MAG TPA: hypothetical protein VGB06_00050, partial [Solirubrobacterales bacterium]
LIVTFAAAVTLLIAIMVGLDLIGAKDDVFVAAFIFIMAGGAFAVSEVVGHYAKDWESRHRQSHNAPPNG